MPHLKELYEKYAKKGLVLIGVHTTNGREKMADFVRDQEIPYPVAKDIEGKTVAAFAIDSFPDYCVIDKRGILRACDLANAEVDRVIEALLAEKIGDEKPPKDTKRLDAEEVFADGLARAKKEQKNLLVHLGAPW